MARSFEIIDIFAGPGGLGEGFSAAGRDNAHRMRIRLSIEMDQHAVRTLRQRAFLRSFGDCLPSAYYAALNANATLPDWSEIEPAAWGDAEREVQQLVLGSEGVFDHVASVLDEVRERTHGESILIGGPPCQAYSLVGRSRNRGKTDYIAEDDHRHYLYREYVRILDRLRPVAFVMENVKGMLSSRVDGGGIFAKVLEDLRGAGDGYELLPIAAPCNLAGMPEARDFLVRAERHGVPQARHRVFIIGIRKGEHALQSHAWSSSLLSLRKETVPIEAVLGGLPRLRSGLSRSDGPEAWQATVREQAQRIARSRDVDAETRRIAASVAAATDLPIRRLDNRIGEPSPELPADLRDWLIDPNLDVVVQHETRGHIPDDLGRYLFAAAWAASGRDVSPKLAEFPDFLQPKHRNRSTGDFADRFRVQCAGRPSTTVTSHISKDGHYFIHPDPMQCRSLTVREAARLQTFPDNYVFSGPRTAQYHQAGNAVPPFLARQIAEALVGLLTKSVRASEPSYSAAASAAE